MKPKVVYWNNIPSPYVVERFSAVERRGNLDFEAWFIERLEPDRSWDVREADWRFRARYLTAQSLAGRRLSLPLAELRAVRPDLVVSAYATASFAFGHLLIRATGARAAFRSSPTFDAWVRRSRPKEFAKHVLFRSIDGATVPGPDGGRMAQRYGLPADRIFSVAQSIDVNHYGHAVEMPSTERERRRSELELRGCVFLYVGRLWSGKGLDYLLDAYAAVHVQYPNTSLLLVGDGVDEARYRAAARESPDVVFAGFVQPRDLPNWYALADAFVFPTLGDPHGLVVEEAMAAGLPVICTEAAGDIRLRVPDGEAGYIVPAADSATLADRMSRLASNPDRRRSFGAEARRLVVSRNHEQYAIDFEAFVEHVLALPPRRTPAAYVARTAGMLLNVLSTTRDVAPLVSSTEADDDP